jgi:hypothetical protein
MVVITVRVSFRDEPPMLLEVPDDLTSTTVAELKAQANHELAQRYPEGGGPLTSKRGALVCCAKPYTAVLSLAVIPVLSFDRRPLRFRLHCGGPHSKRVGDARMFAWCENF